MNRSEFERSVKVSSREIPQEAIQAAISFFTDQRGETAIFQQKDVADAINLAGRWPVSRKIEEKPATVSTVGAREIIYSDLICDALELKVRETRARLFGSEDPPFPGTAKNPYHGMKRASEWLEQARIIESQPRDIAKERDLIETLRGLTRCEVNLRQRSVPFPGDKDEFAIHFIAPIGTPLYGLACDIDQLTAGVFAPAAVSLWVLCDIRPLIPRIQVTTEVMRQGAAATVKLPERSVTTMRLYARDLTWDELWKAYKAIRSQPNAKRQTVNPLHAEIYRMVRERGGPPAAFGEKQKFWESIRKDLKKNKRFKKVPDTWEAIRKAFNEVEKG